MGLSPNKSATILAYKCRGVNVLRVVFLRDCGLKEFGMVKEKSIKVV